ncbi:hypothetical protein [Blastococcus atacamensis]|uniref:hypothetical protein n=1 Tax=Blastococcus atacamensis TaxID=2070508 RepID=UPI000CEC9AD2|nr:hypothetical protein [Blastococcus atacamensis]
MYDYFWWASAMARMDTRDSLAGVHEIGVHLAHRLVAPPEEVTTFNLVRRLASSHTRRGGSFAAALHSRRLEGGDRSRGILPSGADLQLAVEVSPGQWAHLVLQAKKLDAGTGRYKSWERWQVDALRRWASTHGAPVPGMLLYNSATPPFTSPGSGTAVALGACCSSPLTCHGWSWPTWTLPDRRSPLAVTLCLFPPDPAALPAALSGDGPSAVTVNPHAMPLECIFCRGSTLASGWTPAPPTWAVDLLARRPDPDQLDAGTLVDTPPDDPSDQTDITAESWTPRYSLVLDFVLNRDGSEPHPKDAESG